MGGDERGGEAASSSTARAPRQPARPHLGKYPLSPQPVPVPTPAAGRGAGRVPPAALPGGREGGACVRGAGSGPAWQRCTTPRGSRRDEAAAARPQAGRPPSRAWSTPQADTGRGGEEAAGRAPAVRARSGGICPPCCGGCVLTAIAIFSQTWLVAA